LNRLETGVVGQCNRQNAVFPRPTLQRKVQPGSSCRT
jgi:hypothetical protein